MSRCLPRFARNTLVLAVIGLLAAPGWAADASTEDRLKALEARLDAMEKENRSLKQQLQQTDQKVEATGDQVEKIASQGTTGNSVLASWAENTKLGGYGEITYNRYTNHNKNNEADLRRFVLFFSHRFNDNLHFFSELEMEHGVTSKDDAGEAEVEQAYLDYHVSDALNFKAGLFLMPIGLLNETHEPPTYYGVERNEVETRIIPTTWREGGIGIHGEIAQGLSYDTGIVTSFNAGKIDDPSVGFRSGHQELTLSRANDLSIYAALNYRGIPGLLVGGGIFTGNTGQDGFTDQGGTPQQPLLQGVNARLTLWDLHTKYTQGNLDLQALYARGTLSNADAVSAAAVADGRKGAIPKSIYGWYGQAAYHVWHSGDFDLAPFVRYEKYNTQQQVAGGFPADPLNDERVITAGLNFMLHPQVVLKTDFQKYKTDNGRNRLNVGVGYMF